MASTRYGYVIRIGGDPEIAGALKSGIETGTGTAAAGTSSAPAGAPSPEGKALGSDAVRRVAMMQHTPEEWAAMTTKARYDYGQTRQAPRWARRLLVAYAMLCYGLAQAFRAQRFVLERRDD